MLRAVHTLLLTLSLAWPATALSPQQSAAQPAPEPAPAAHKGEAYDALHPAPDAPIPREQQLREAIQKLTTTCRVMEVVAHPDDEDGPLLTELARGRGCQVMLFTVTRGEGGQNASGAIFGDELGLLRTMELLAADKVYGADERFSRVADFGFSKTPEESFAKWGGKEVPLGDLVRQIRLFRPDVLIARFSGTPRDGHGHHQASSILTQEAFHVAADPARFPEQKLPPWQAKKLYIGNIPEDEATLTIDNGKVDPVLGEAPARVALGGLRHQASQGLGDLQYNPARAVTRLRLVDVGPGFAKVNGESSVTEGLNDSTAALSLGDASAAAALAPVPTLLESARSQTGRPELAGQSLLKAAEAFGNAANAMTCGGSRAPRAACENALEGLLQKLKQAGNAVTVAFGIEWTAATRPGTPALLSAGTVVPVHVELKTQVALHNVTGCIVGDKANSAAETVSVRQVKCSLSKSASLGKPAVADVKYTMPGGPAVRVPVHRNNGLVDTSYQLDTPEALDHPLPEASVWASVTLHFGNSYMTLWKPVLQPSLHSALFLAPALTIATQPDAALRTTQDSSEAEQEIWTESHSPAAALVTVKLDTPPDWVLTPKSNAVQVAADGKDRTQFLVMPPRQPADSHVEVGAVATAGGRNYSEGVHLLTRPDLDAFPFYFPARTKFSFLKVEFPPNLKIGYIMGAGDTLPDALQSLGVDVSLLTAGDLAHGDLSAYQTIVTGIRSYATRPDLRQNNGRLLEWVRHGGTMIVQYEQDFGGFNAGRFAPYPLTLGNIRADQEELPVKVLQPDDSVFHAPNTVSAADFDGWIQERGLYFAKEWSPEYTPLLSMADAGEPAHEGALLRAKVGKGIWIYSGLAMFRQVPNGVPGATRLFVNLLSAGHTAADAPVVSARTEATP